MTRYIVPTAPQPETFTVALAGADYRLTLRWAEAAEGGWLLDLALADGTPLVAGVPLVTGVDLLAPYPHLGIGGMLWVLAADESTPAADELGQTAQLIFETEGDA